mmetsp:Transcript_8968/g.15587  ORF Transcript_8968/g.15587 Transcript_8968/m.15587 type:complete len:231 (-) Transcript_8968:340-1032(-)|eukprot:CAMPEP_0183759222 /NCGR_PEP_ID=MMETSP0739-20130205/6949_1 /TAXON_ID=385413 /ORGANISM="Thalassiosira miniscula, Strain CCMP1093" /LENGTH=230 /DNA_ID=CAMNT_0025996973 /DNA_START=56 /DNA_END=748 /DNA_ORIENTATION=-
MTPQEISFTNAFNANRPTLASFSKCASQDELHIVRDTFFIGMASQLCHQEYESFRVSLITDPTSFTSIASTLNTPKGLEAMVTAARASDGWEALLSVLDTVATAVNSDLDDIWMTLEKGRLEWLGALNSAHPLKVILKDALDQDEKTSDRDVLESKMIYIYALSLSLPSIEESSKESWRKVVKMEDKTNPLKNYDADLWDCRKDEWRPLDLGVQAAAERGGSSFEAAWAA